MFYLWLGQSCGIYWELFLRSLHYVSLLLHSSDDITHSSLLKISQYTYTPNTKSEEEQKCHKTKTVISQKRYKIAKTCEYKINSSKSSALFKVWMKSVTKTVWKQYKFKQGWVWSFFAKFFYNFPFILMGIFKNLFCVFLRTLLYESLPKVIAHHSW